MNYGVVIEREANFQLGKGDRTSNLEPNEEWMLILNELLRWVREREGGSFRQMLLFEEGLEKERRPRTKGGRATHTLTNRTNETRGTKCLVPGRSGATETNGTNE